MPIATVRFQTLGELIDRVTPSAPDPVTGRRRDTGVYRGCSDARATLRTSLDMLDPEKPHGKSHLEAHILRNFIRHSRPHFRVPPVNDWELLVTAQHHGLPTRLMDWTYSPLVAAHFATIFPSKGDRVVWRLEWQELHRKFKFPDVAFLIQDLAQISKSDEGLTPWKLFKHEEVPREFACLLDPPSLDARIVAQSAAFTLCTDTSRPFEEFLAAHNLEDALTKFVIAAEDVAKVRDQLDLVGVNERQLFPDLDGVSAEMRRYYR
jgi:hypothetical protein